MSVRGKRCCDRNVQAMPAESWPRLVEFRVVEVVIVNRDLFFFFYEFYNLIDNFKSLEHWFVRSVCLCVQDSDSRGSVVQGRVPDPQGVQGVIFQT